MVVEQVGDAGLDDGGLPGAQQVDFFLEPIDPDHGVLRLSFLHYTAEEEAGRLIEALDALL